MARTTRSANKLSKTNSRQSVKSYREKDESDLEVESDADGFSTDDNISEDNDIQIWLKDDLSKENDVKLDSDDEDSSNKDQELNALLKNKYSKNENDDDENEDSDEDGADTATVSLKLKKLNEFVKQSQVYSSIIADTLLERTKQRLEEEQKARESNKENIDVKEVEPPKKKQRKIRNIVDFFKKTDKSTEVKNEIEETHKTEAVVDEEQMLSSQPNLLKNCILKQYQLEGLNWLVTLYENGLNGILADDMGLGKTIQTIALLAFIYEMDTKGPFLIAAPLSTIDNWVSEFDRFAPDIPVLKYYHQNGIKERTRLLNNFFKETKGTGVILTSYEIIIRDADEIMSRQWKFLVVDEGHRLKNINCRLIQELKRINTSNRLLLTGTPLQNNISELWSLLNFILPDIFTDFEIFNKWFDFESLHLGSNSKKLNKLINDELEKNLISNLHTILKPFLLRRLKKIVLADILPPKREYIINCPLAPMQKKFYTKALSGQLKVTIFKELVKQFFTLNTGHIGTVSNKSIRDFINFELHYGKENKADLKDQSETIQNMHKLYQEHLHRDFKNKKLMNMMMQLRQIVDSTFLFYFPYLEPEELTLDILLQSSGKLQVLQKLAIPMIKKGHKILIFSQFVNMLDLLEDWCDLNSIKSLRIDGTVDNDTRKEQIKLFDNPKDKHQVFLLSTRAAGLGINLVAADTVFIFDSDWNPQVDLQAMDRCYRIGQTKPVIVYRLCCDNTIEHIILTRAANKRMLERMVIQMGNFNKLKTLAMNERSFLQTGPASNKVKNTELVQELSLLLSKQNSSIGFKRDSGDNPESILTHTEIKALTDRSDASYRSEREMNYPHITLFETTLGLS
ncbi:hypothetical protein TPHA_0B02800 [Tetrapisispora phaffii CBS 4417]|uniref:Irc5p n=1 Tax=Tetrapisispora phaffii (strain ATCC 24235 / CBS 4417 / NBRC 1672 / NRRL Y-8282 / UCD 70-5) TaxID=1071381 RepID=G8BPM1_TETPH|nr:hypothetical protein TPHA_0B02800 [Tetrapisispora phaffii CBS 4417]CCE61952.1 hypothetical protein TPHA_0B02800 [Tetrapisispora phaffii CBS 4417]